MSDVKIGIFVCDCGQSLNKMLDFEKLTAEVKNIPRVECVERHSFLCSQEGLEFIKNKIKELKLNRVVVAACSPKLIESKFFDILAKANLDRSFLLLANIREQCAWVFQDRAKATHKAIDIIASLVRKSLFLKSIERKDISLEKDVLVIGGGIAGLEAAIELSKLKGKVILIEKEAVLGGEVNYLASFHGTETTPKELINKKLEAVRKIKNIEVFYAAELVDLKGCFGDFSALIRREGKEITKQVGAVVVATGFKTDSTQQPYLSTEKMVSLKELEKLIVENNEILTKSKNKNVCFLLNKGNLILSKAALKNALFIREVYQSNVFVLTKNVLVAEEGLERLYQKARIAGVMFFKFDDQEPQINICDTQLEISFEDQTVKEKDKARGEIKIPCDLAIVEEEIKPQDGYERIQQILGINLGPADFYQEDNVTLFPVDSNRKGIYVVGSCRYPQSVSGTMVESSAAAFKIYDLLSEGKTTIDLDNAIVDPEKCVLCLTCIRSCPHKAIIIDYTDEAAKVVESSCQRCGICVADCPAKAIQMANYTDEQILAEVVG